MASKSEIIHFTIEEVDEKYTFFLFYSPKSPRKSVKDYVSNVGDFVAPFENFLDFDNFLNYSTTIEVDEKYTFFISFL